MNMSGRMGGILMLGISMIFIAIGFIIYPIVMTAINGILTWSEVSGTTTYSIASFTGLAQIAGVTPLLILVGFLYSVVVVGFFGVKMIKSGEGEISPTGILLTSIGMIFIAIGFIIYPIVLTGTVAILAATTTAMTGVASFAPIAPLLVFIGYLAATVLLEYFGTRQMAAQVD